MPDKALQDIPQGDSNDHAGDAETVIRVQAVTKTFAQWQRVNAGEGVLRGLLHPAKKILTALDDVSFQVRRGEFVAYAGPNGAGKSTTMKLLCSVWACSLKTGPS